MMRTVAILAMLLTTGALSGCGTLISLGEKAEPFGGVVLDGTIIARGAPQGLPMPGGDIDILSLWPLAVLDLPLSLAGDAALLPFTIAYALMQQLPTQ